MKEKISVVVLAAGRGKRLKSQSQKVTTLLSGKPILCYLFETIESISPDKIIVVVGHKKEDVFSQLEGKEVLYAEQPDLLGTGDAVMQAGPLLQPCKGDVIILCGDAPFISKATLEGLIKTHRQESNSVTLLTCFIDSPTGYGRIKRDSGGRVEGIIEDLNASEEEKSIKEINSGAYIFNAGELMEALGELKRDELKGEYYLTDTVSILADDGKRIGAYVTPNSEECIGINTSEDLKKAEKILKRR